LVITMGDGTATARQEQIAAEAVGRVSALVAVLMALVLYVWHVLRGGELVRALSDWTRTGNEPARRSGLWISAAVVLAWFAALGGHLLAQWQQVPGYPVGSRAGYLTGLAVACLAVLVLVSLARRQQQLRQAMRLVLEAPTAQLRSAAVGTLVELAVRVADAAQIVRGPLSGCAHAWTGLTVTRVYRSGKNHSADILDRGRAPARLPVLDGSGAGELDLTRVVLDVRALRRVLRKADVARDPTGSLLGDLTHQDFTSFELEEQLIDQGEMLYALGQVQEHKVVETGPSYRAPSSVPIVGGAPGRPLVLHAGTEQSLLARLRRERFSLDLTVGAYGLLTLGLLGLMAAAAIVW
jgi:hypothetical protein